MKKQIKVQLDKNDIRQIESAISDLESEPEVAKIKILGGSYLISRFNQDHANRVDAVSVAVPDVAGAKKEKYVFNITINEKGEVVDSDYDKFQIGDFIKDSGDDISLLPFYISVESTKEGSQKVIISQSVFKGAKIHYAFKPVNGKEIASISICKKSGNENLTISDSRKKAKDLGYDGVFTHAQYSALWILEAFLNKKVAKKDGPLFKDLGLRSGSSWEWFDGIYVKGSSLFVSSDESSDPKPEKMLIDSVKANYEYCSFRVDEDGLLVPDKKGDKVSVYLPINDPGVVTLASGGGLDGGYTGLFDWYCNYGWGGGSWHAVGLRPFKVCFKEEK